MSEFDLEELQESRAEGIPVGLPTRSTKSLAASLGIDPDTLRHWKERCPDTCREGYEWIRDNSNRIKWTSLGVEWAHHEAASDAQAARAASTEEDAGTSSPKTFDKVSMIRAAAKQIITREDKAFLVRCCMQELTCFDIEEPVQQPQAAISVPIKSEPIPRLALNPVILGANINRALEAGK